MDFILISDSVKPEWLCWWFCKHGERHVRKRSPMYFSTAAQSMFLAEENQLSRSLGEQEGGQGSVLGGKKWTVCSPILECVWFYYIARA